MLTFQIDGCTGVADLGGGEWRVDFVDSSRLATAAEVLAAKRATQITAVKLKAREVVLAVLPEWKQVNMTARMLEKLYLAETDDAEWQAMQGAWDWVKAVRAHSDALEALVAAAEDPDSIDVTAGWPG